MGSFFSKDPEKQYQKLRTQAGDAAKQRNECAEKSKKAFLDGDHKAAKHWSEEKTKYEASMENANDKAANTIFDHNNQKHSPDTIDLHGLYKAEAMKLLAERVETCKKSKADHLIVVVGRGTHSKNGKKLEPATATFATKNGIEFERNVPRDGCITFRFSHGRSKCIIL